MSERSDLNTLDSPHTGAEPHAFKFDGDLFVLAFLSYTDVPDQFLHRADHGKLPGGRRVERLWAMSMMVIVTIAQVMMAYTISLHVKNDLIDTRTRPLLTSFEMFVGNNWTIPIGLADSICGSWEDVEAHSGMASGPLSSVTMPDGVTFAGNDYYPLFYNLKQPTRTWNYGMLGADRSKIEDIMYVIAEGVTLSPFTHSGYSVMFIMMLTLFSFSVVSELRKIILFLSMLLCLPGTPPDGHSGRLKESRLSSEEEELQALGLKLTWISAEARRMGFIVLFFQTMSTVVVGVLGVVFLLYTTVKIDLILNGLAVLFVVELDNAVFFATVPHVKQRMIEDLQEVEYSSHRPNKIMGVLEVIGPILVFPLSLAAATGMRFFQVGLFKQIFHMAAAICLFAGPTPGGYDNFDKLVGPVAGFCDSLLGMSCAGSVSPASAAEKNGYCVVTDQTPVSLPTIQMYVEEAFPGRRKKDGTMRLRSGELSAPGVYKEWGRADQRLYDSGLWMDGPYQNMMRASCVQMYRNQPPADLMVDPGTGGVMDGAPFMCSYDELTEAVFGPVRQAILQNVARPESAKLNKGKTLEILSKVRTIFDPEVVRAIDRCALASQKKQMNKGQARQKGDAVDKNKNIFGPDGLPNLDNAMFLGSHRQHRRVQ